MEKKLFVSNLPHSMSDDELKDTFAAAGTVDSAKIISDRDTGRSRGFGFVEMSSEEEAQKAIQELHGKSVDGREMRVEIARPREPRGERSWNR